MLYAERGDATVRRPSVCPSVCDVRCRDHAGWNTSKKFTAEKLNVYARIDRIMGATPPKLGWNRGGVMSTKTSNIRNGASLRDKTKV